MATKLSKSVAVTADTYRDLVRISGLTGLPIGEIATVAINGFLQDKLDLIKESNRSVILGDAGRISTHNRR